MSIMPEALSNIEKELAELIEDEMIGSRILWENIATRASPPLRSLIECKRTDKAFVSQPMAYLVAKSKLEAFGFYREQIRKWKRQKEAKARAVMASEHLAQANSEPNTTFPQKGPTPLPEHHEGSGLTKDGENQSNEVPAGGSLSTLTNEGGEEEENSITEDEEPDFEESPKKPSSATFPQKGHNLTLAPGKKKASVRAKGPANDNLEKFEPEGSIGESPDANNLSATQTITGPNDLALSFAEMDLAVLLEEWKRIAGHRKFDFDVIGSRGSPELKASLHDAQMQSTAIAIDSVQSVVRVDRYIAFRAFRRVVHSHLTMLSRGNSLMTCEERARLIASMQTPKTMPPKNTSEASPSIIDRPVERKRKGTIKSNAPGQKETVKPLENDVHEDYISSGQVYGLNKTEGEIAWILEHLKFMMHAKKGLWQEVEGLASEELRMLINRHKHKTNFRKIPLRFLTRRSVTQAFKEYRVLIAKELKEGKKGPPIESSTKGVAAPGDETESAEKKQRQFVESDVQLQKRTRRGHKDELTHEFKELAELAIQFDDGKEGIWVDIFKNASPHLQVLLRTKTPQSPASPPESLVPLHLRPAFRTYCAARLSELNQRDPFDLDDDVSEEKASHEALESVMNGIRVTRPSTSHLVTHAFQRQGKRLGMVFAKLEIEIEDFVRQEEDILERETTATKGDTETNLDKVMTRLRSDFLSFREQEEDSFEKIIKEYRISTLEKPDKTGNTFESMQRSYYKTQGQRVEAFLIRLNETLICETAGSSR